MTLLSSVGACLLLDTTSLISLFASRRMDQIIQALPVPVAVVAEVAVHEAKYIRGADGIVLEPIDLQPLVTTGLLVTVPLTATDCALAVNLVAQCNIDNGESLTAAVALRLGGSVVTDDRVAQQRIGQLLAHLPFFATSQILQVWATASSVPDRDIRSVLQQMHHGGNYQPDVRDQGYTWLRTYL